MSYINSIKVGDTNYSISLNSNTIGDGFSLENGVLSLKLGTGLVVESKGKIFMPLGSGLAKSPGGGNIFVQLGTGLTYDENNGALTLKLGTGLALGEDGKLYATNLENYAQD